MDLRDAPFEHTALRAFYGHVPSAVLALAAERSGERIVMAVSSFTTVSLAPPLLTVSIRRESETWPALREGRIGGSLLGSEQAELARAIASGPMQQRLDNVPVVTADSGAIFMAGATSWFEGELVEEFPAGDHLLALIRLQAIAQEPSVPPLIFHRSVFGAVHAV